MTKAKTGEPQTVEVAARYGQPDASGASWLSQIGLLGVNGVKEVRVSSLYAIEGGYSASQLHQLSRDLLADPITQEYRLDRSTPSQAFLLGPHWRVEVWLKPAVTDAVGESVAKAVTDLGLPAPERVRTGTAYSLLGKIAKAQVDRLAAELLSNPVIHQVTIEQS